MIGIIATSSKTFNVDGDLTYPNPVEGNIYYDSQDGRLYYYSTTETRSNPNNGFFPIWNGTTKYISRFSIEKYIDQDVIKLDLKSMNSKLDKETANKIIYERKKADAGDILTPLISDGDNAFTQCIKGVINSKHLTIMDLTEMNTGGFTQNMIENYYMALMKISFMRIEKWYIWIDKILHVGFQITVTKDGEVIVGYNYPKNKFNSVGGECRSILLSDDDPFKKIIKMIMLKLKIDKNDLKNDEVDDYTINNMMTTLNSKKPLSIHLFSRFIQLANLSYTMKIVDNGKVIFEYHE